MVIPTLLIALILALTTVVALIHHRDTFHPALLIVPMLAFFYCYWPAMLEATGGFYGYLWDEHVARAQWIHLAGVLGICAGLVIGSAGAVRSTASPLAYSGYFDRKTLLWASIIFGMLGLWSFSYQIVNVGGFSQAYGRAYGGGYIESGYVREITVLALPALLLLTLGRRSGPMTLRELGLMLACASPFLIHGLLGGRRGPTFVGLVGPVMVFYMSRNKRPRLATVLAGGLLLGVLMLALVSNRSRIYWGADMDLDASPTDYLRPGAGNDFIYAAGLAVVMDETQDFAWGTNYLTMLFVRPIPRAIWPTKYEDAARFFDRPNMEQNLGVDIQAFRYILGWDAAVGAAPGVIGDMFREFSWGMPLAMLTLGWFYGYAWRRGIGSQGAWLPVYCLLTSLSLYLIMQSLEAMLYRFLLAVPPMVLALRLARRTAVHAAAKPESVERLENA